MTFCKSSPQQYYIIRQISNRRECNKWDICMQASKKWCLHVKFTFTLNVNILEFQRDMLSGLIMTILALWAFMLSHERLVAIVQRYFSWFSRCNTLLACMKITHLLHLHYYYNSIIIYQEIKRVSRRQKFYLLYLQIL